METIYDKDGNGKQVDSVDAREHVATGRWFVDPPRPKIAEEKPVSKSKLSKKTQNLDD